MGSYQNLQFQLRILGFSLDLLLSMFLVSSAMVRNLALIIILIYLLN